MERREARRSALWIGSSLPLEGQAQPQGEPTGRRSGPRLSALRFPLYWDCEGFEQNLERQPAGMCRAATLPHVSTKCTEQETMPRPTETTIVQQCPDVVKRDCFAEPVFGPAKGQTCWLAKTADVVIERQTSLRGARGATKRSPPRGWSFQWLVAGQAQQPSYFMGQEWSERRDSNSGPPVPQTGALTGLRYAPTPQGPDIPMDLAHRAQGGRARRKLQAAALHPTPHPHVANDFWERDCIEQHGSSRFRC